MSDAEPWRVAYTKWLTEPQAGEATRPHDDEEDGHDWFEQACANCFRAGYLAATAHLSAEREELREALRHGAIFDVSCNWDANAFALLGDAAQKEIIAALSTELARQIVSSAAPNWLNSSIQEDGRPAWNIQVFAMNAATDTFRARARKLVGGQ